MDKSSSSRCCLIYCDSCRQNIRRIVWFSTTEHQLIFSRNVRNYLDIAFPKSWIGCGRPVSWPPRYPDLSAQIFFSLGVTKCCLYETPIASPEDLVVQIHAAAAEARNLPLIFQRVQDYMHRRCIAAAGCSFEHLL